MPINIEIDGYNFDAVFEEVKSPESCAAFQRVMPFKVL